jgi:SAM-dependent MidA family methyltransferase
MQAMNALAKIIRDEAARRGVLPFARFMELALYHPALGYYETPRHSPGRRGDFFTSVSTGELFGQLLACQFAGWLEAEGGIQKSEVRIIEAGAHDGRLAADILSWLRIHRPKLFDQIEYGIIEPSNQRQEWQRETLKAFTNVRWFPRFNDSTIQRFNGIIFSNELLDAFPVHRFGWDAKSKTWFEWGVAVEREKFVWAKIKKPEVRSQKSESALPASIFQLSASLLEVLPDGYTIEASPAAERWWREAAAALARGKLLAIDYGLTADEMFSPARTRGTLRAYSQHQVTDDPLANPGGQDLTAHVNFSAIQKAGEDAGLATEFFGSQAKFLVDILATAEKNKLSGELVASKRSEAGWNAKQTRQFQTLTHPEHLGRAFRVLIQSR